MMNAVARPAPPRVTATITALRPASGHERAERIRDVIDAFRRLRESVERFNRSLAPDADAASASADSATSLQPLLSSLARRAELAGFARQRELKRAIRDARQLDKTRDALFSDAFCLDTEAMRATAAELERIDTALVSLCVEHVMARHAQRAEGADGWARAPQVARATTSPRRAAKPPKTEADAPSEPVTEHRDAA
ncbi:conserved hypothetical protein [Paraburkholderia tropica]|uniref:hypothetical protein n=1 Tax=Paraburkholderia tropica TaxID=92647 RepID=UPI001CB1958E|nr:hypothetical protein [Paraburkholderia tropica]CAG9225199.1 conserved hypothetical protein [Paraburkholderia tropica]